MDDNQGNKDVNNNNNHENDESTTSLESANNDRKPNSQLSLLQKASEPTVPAMSKGTLMSKPSGRTSLGSTKDADAKSKSSLKSTTAPASKPGAVSVTEHSSQELRARERVKAKEHDSAKRTAAVAGGASSDDKSDSSSDDDDDDDDTGLEDETKKFPAAVDEKKAYRATSQFPPRPGAMAVRETSIDTHNAVADEKAQYRTSKPAAPAVGAVRATSIGSNNSSVADVKAQYRTSRPAAEPGAVRTTSVGSNNSSVADPKAQYRTSRPAAKPGADRSTSVSSNNSSMADEKASYRSSSNPRSRQPGVSAERNDSESVPSSMQSIASEPGASATSNDSLDEKAKYRKKPPPPAAAGSAQNKNNMELDARASDVSTPASTSSQKHDNHQPRDEKEAFRLPSSSTGVAGATAVASIPAAKEEKTDPSDAKMNFRNMPAARPDSFDANHAENDDESAQHGPDFSLSQRDIEGLSEVYAMTDPVTVHNDEEQPKAGDGTTLTNEANLQYKKAQARALRTDAEPENDNDASSTAAVTTAVTTAVTAPVARVASSRGARERLKSVTFDEDGGMILRATLAPSNESIRNNLKSEIRQELVNEAAADIRNQALHDLDVVVGEVIPEGDEEELKRLEVVRKRNARIYLLGILACILLTAVIIAVSVVTTQDSRSSQTTLGATPSPTAGFSQTASPITVIPTSPFPSGQPSIAPTNSAIPSSMPSASAIPSSQPSNFRIRLDIQILNDRYSEETSFDLVNDETLEVIVSQVFDDADTFRLVSTEVYLFAGNYSFTIHDSFGDGNCCQHGYGSYQILFEGGQRLTGSKFGFSQTSQIVIGEGEEIGFSTERSLEVSVSPDNFGFETLEDLESFLLEEEKGLLGECLGHCAYHENCPGLMKCSSPDWQFDIPGCMGIREPGVRYCFFPDDLDRSLRSRSSPSSIQEAPLGICEGGCVDEGDCFGDLTCFVSDETSLVPGCDGMGEANLNYCVVNSELEGDLAIVASRAYPEHEPLYPLGRCHGGCVSDEDCTGTLECFTDTDNVAIPGCRGIGGSGYCYDPLALALDGSLNQETAPRIGAGGRRRLNYVTGEDGWKAFYTPGAVVGKLTFYVSNFPPSIKAIDVLFSDDEEHTIGNDKFSNVNEEDSSSTLPEIIEFEFDENERLQTFRICPTDGESLSHVSFSTTLGNTLSIGSCLNPSQSEEFNVNDRVLTGLVARTTLSIESLAPLVRQERYCDEGKDWIELEDQCFYNTGVIQSFSSCEALCQNEFNASPPCIYDHAMNNFLATSFGPQRLWVGMASLYRWGSTCSSSYYNWYEGGFQPVDSASEGCVSLEGGNFFAKETTIVDGFAFYDESGGGDWKETPCDSTQVQCVCQKSHPVKITPRGKLPSSFYDSADAAPSTISDLQINGEYSLDTEIQSLDFHEAAANLWGGHVTSVLSREENDLFEDLEYDGFLFFESLEPMSQNDCYKYCGSEDAESLCIEDEEMETFLIDHFATWAGFWTGYDGQTNAGRFAWNNRGCNSDYVSIPRNANENANAANIQLCLEVSGSSRSGEDWLLRPCENHYSSCVCMRKDPCSVPSNDLSSEATTFSTTSLVSIGLKFNEGIDDFEWLDGSSWGDFSSFLSIPQNIPDQSGAGIVGSGDWVVTNPNQRACAAWWRQKQYLLADIVNEDMTHASINMVPEVPLIENVGLRNSHLHHVGLGPGIYRVTNGTSLDIIGSRQVTYELQPLLAIVRQGFVFSLGFDFQSTDGSCRSKVCFLGVCWGTAEYSALPKRVVVEPDEEFGRNHYLIIEQNCGDSSQARATFSSLSFNSQAAYRPKYLTSTTRTMAYDISSFPLEECFGGCSTDNDCLGDLVCFQRESPGRVFGCPGLASQSWGYCSVPMVEALNISLPPVTVCEPQRAFSIWLKTDTFGVETSLELHKVDAFFSILVAFGSGFGSNSEYLYTGCLEEGSYIFTIKDSFGDGICCANGEGEYAFVVGGEWVAYDPADGTPWTVREHTFSVSGLNLLLPPERDDCRVTNTFSLSLSTDFYPEDTSWEIEEAGSSVVVASGSGYLIEQTARHDGCLPDGLYVFVFYDSVGDGFDGNYEFRAGNSTVARSIPGNFRERRYQFSMPQILVCSNEGYPVCSGYPLRAYCDGSPSNCNLPLCSCDVGRDVCERNFNPCLPV